MPYAAGLVLALLTAVLARLAGLDRDRAIYPTLLIVIASYYVLFAVVGRSVHALLVESAALTAFAIAAMTGFRSNLWLIVAALAAHGFFDWFHGRLVTNPGVPVWWPGFCLAFDVGLAACLAVLLSRGKASSHRADGRSP